jgi:glycosyltransferase involved in cell wall biosynthesis
MAKNKNKKKNVKRPAGVTQPKVRLSQCMIVKNEEKNIERALGWAKDIAFEQIVVDTGSTDRTVELAEKMGAKVYHFEWINDFAAAKNYAMDLAKGNWIAFLDADEYMPEKDAKELIYILKRIQDDPVASEKCDTVQCTFLDLDDNGNVSSVTQHQRIFQNRDYLRFEGRIHEVIKIKHGIFEAPNIKIIHTGYTRAAYKEINKTERNLALLRKEHEKDPDNPDIMFYLADSLKTAGTDEALEEAEQLFLKALANKQRVENRLTMQLAYYFLIREYMKDESKWEEAFRLCDEAITDLPGYIDYYYYRAVLSNRTSNYRAAQDDLSVCENALLSTDTTPLTHILFPCPILLFYQLLISAGGLSDEQGITRNETIIKTILSENKEKAEIIGSYITALITEGVSENKVMDELSLIYDINDPKDILTIARAAKEGRSFDFARNIMKKAGDMMKS